MCTNTSNPTRPLAATVKTLLAFTVGCMTLFALSPSAHAVTEAPGLAASFDPSWFVQGVTGLFALATLGTGTLAMFKLGHPLLVDTSNFIGVDSNEQVSAPNVRCWGARQIATGVTLWAALFLGDEVLFQVGLASVVIRQALDILANLLDRRPLMAVPYLALAVPAVAALLQVI